MTRRLLLTSDFLHPGDEVDDYLRSAGFATLHAPLTGRRTPSELIELLDGVEGALIANEPLTAEVLSASVLRAVVRTGVGHDSIDLTAASGLGISISNLPGINANAVAEYTIGLILAAARGLVPSAAGVAAGGWPRHDGFELRGATLGLVGYGTIAQAVVPLARAFGLQVLCTTKLPRADPAVHFVALPELLGSADFVSLHTSLTEQTRGLIGAAQLRLMRPNAVLVNTSRGPVVDEEALAAAVRDGVIAGAQLDVVAEEPLPTTSPLRNVPGIVVYSHLAGQTAQARQAAGKQGAAELVAALAGRPRYRVNMIERKP
ncbi:phosphoglycerate dehydrogenase [Kribbella sandramycini]|uniref:Phosphoglycerate dehydrogenase n=1 Tax=Kribbella sandramycini TaxID=60450 RepID=A0A7Y4P3A0_9ACTN|nr:phosphoglycerate dehydrogenase [Kribbella sandramycini]MBB6568885.1 D-3-phosphoglycerate dehydrogenase/(S)-sulfolactate dehydrogenase [Kribbella sandramycini]NOL45651.1 phosphoglycerate dehydrogenase [Kribbella sandramycini]